MWKRPDDSGGDWGQWKRLKVDQKKEKAPPPQPPSPPMKAAPPRPPRPQWVELNIIDIPGQQGRTGERFWDFSQSENLRLDTKSHYWVTNEIGWQLLGMVPSPMDPGVGGRHLECTPVGARMGPPKLHLPERSACALCECRAGYNGMRDHDLAMWCTTWRWPERTIHVPVCRLNAPCVFSQARTLPRGSQQPASWPTIQPPHCGGMTPTTITEYRINERLEITETLLTSLLISVYGPPDSPPLPPPLGSPNLDHGTDDMETSDDGPSLQCKMT